MFRRHVPALTVLAALALASPAAALLGAGSSTIDRAAQGLREKPVYVDPRSGDVLPNADAAKLVEEIDSRKAGPLYIVVLPQAAADAVGGDPAGALRDIQSELRRPGVYAGIIGTRFLARGGLPRGRAEMLARAASKAHHSDGTAAVLTDFVDRIGAARNGGGGGSGSTIPWILLGLIAAAGAALVANRRVRRAAGREPSASERPGRRA